MKPKEIRVDMYQGTINGVTYPKGYKGPRVVVVEVDDEDVLSDSFCKDTCKREQDHHLCHEFDVD